MFFLASSAVSPGTNVKFSLKFAKAKSATNIQLKRVFFVFFHLLVSSNGNVLVKDFEVAFQVYK